VSALPAARPRPAPPPARRPAASRTPRLRAVPPPAPRGQRVPTWAYALVAAVLLVGGVLGIVALNALAAEASFRARALEDDLSELTLRHDELVVEVATLAAPGRVRQVAAAQLGLIQPEQPGFLSLDPGALARPGGKAPLPPLDRG
jgi:hypothetical protein